MGTRSRHVKFGLKIPNRLGKMSENLRDLREIFWLTLYLDEFGRKIKVVVFLSSRVLSSPRRKLRSKIQMLS